MQGGIIYMYPVLASFVVAIASFWYPLNALSLLLAFASLISEICNWRGQIVKTKRSMVNLGICGMRCYGEAR